MVLSWTRMIWTRAQLAWMREQQAYPLREKGGGKERQD